MKNKRLSKIMAIVLAVLMVLSNYASVFAATNEGTGTQAFRKGQNTITSQPEETTVTEGETAVFTVEATGKVKGYQWQYNTTGNAKDWKNITDNESAKTAALSLVADLADNGIQVRAIVEYSRVSKLTSEAAKLWVAEKEEEPVDEPEPEDPVVEDEPVAEPARPAVEFEAQQVGDVVVNVTAPEGAFPEGTEMTVEAVADMDSVQEAVDAIDTVNGKVVTAVNITFTYEGEEIQPAVPVNVVMSSPEIAAVENPVVVHVPDEAPAEEVTVEENAVPEEVEFVADSFSVYAVVSPGSTEDNARATLNFYGKDTTKPVATFYVKNADLTDDTALSQIVYDPGVDGLAAGEIFKGWSVSTKNTTDGLDYTSTTPSKDIEAIRTFLKTLTIAEGDVYNIYAMIFQAYNVQFKDEDGVMIHGETLINKAGEAVSYVIGTDYTPKTEDQQFQGWYATTTASDAITPVKDRYQVGETVNIKGDVIFTPNAPTGNWLIFDSNLGDDTENKASYTPPQFVEDGLTGTQPANPTRIGYTFGGWYTDAACSTAFNFNTVITSRTRVYAKWTVVATAPYTVIIWKQRATDDKNAADENKKYDVEEVISLTGSTNSTVTTITQPNSNTNVNTGRGNSVRNYSVNGTQKSYTGFHAARYDSGKTINANGTTVVNVYYDRNLITINFDAGSGRYIRNEVDGGYSRRVTYTGLFDSPLTFSWPSRNWTNANGTGTEYQNLWTHDSSNGGATLTFYGSFKLYVPTNVTETLTRADAGYTPVRFIRQKPDGTWPTSTDDADYVLTVNTAGGTFTFSEKYNGFSVSEYRTSNYTTSNTGWTSVRNSSGGYRSVSNYSQLNIRFTRNKYPINFFDGTYFNGDGVTVKEATGVNLKTTEEIYYQASTESYNKGGANYYVPTAPAGYVFAGWYIDKTCTSPYTFDIMPDGGISVYAKWVATQYRIFLHANVDPSDTSLDWGDQSMCFRVDEDEKLANGNKIIGTRDEYELVGWYTDEAFTNPFNFDAYTINSGLPFLTDYDQTQSTELDKYSRPTSSINSDAVNNRVWILKKLDLYAKWRSTMKGSRGIQVIYDAVDGTNSANGQKEYTDPLYYLDSAKAIAQPASTPTDNKLHFVNWVVQKWNGSAWVDTSVIVSPGDSFEVLKNNALREDNPDWDGKTENEQYLYTIRVRAEYGLKDTPTPTHITWYDNFTENPVEGTNYVTDDNLQINKAVDIEPADRFTRPGYKFLGWARVETTDDQGTPIEGYTLSPQDLTADDLYLVYNEETGKFTQDGTEVTQVAADEKYPYHDMYAVWEIEYFYVYHSSEGTLEAIPITSLTSDGKYDLTAKVASGYLYGGYYAKFGGVETEDINVAKADAKKETSKKADVENADIYDGKALKSSTHANTRFWMKDDAAKVLRESERVSAGKGNEVTPEADDVYYLKEVPTVYLKTNARWVYDIFGTPANKILNIYLLTGIDESLYSEVGFTVDNTESAATVVSNFSYQKRNGDTTPTKLTAKELITQRGYIGVVDITSSIETIKQKESGIVVKPYWKTLDGVKVETSGYTFSMDLKDNPEKELTTSTLVCTPN